MYTILHISDLHRSEAEPLSNAALLASLLADRDRYRTETPEIPAPNAIVVSGDIVQGAQLNNPNWDRDVTCQYDVAYDFLEQLAIEFVGGDRSKVILVPGNHDVCWNTAKSAMAPVLLANEPARVAQIFSQRGSRHRWSWEDRQFFEITDLAKYIRRSQRYWDFVERYYAGIDLVDGLDRNRGYNLFELDEGRIIVAAFDSIHGNDCFAYAGAFAEDAIPNCALSLRKLKPYHLRMAVWHHSIAGSPYRLDYMDVSAIHDLIGNGFRLGLHGHQHIAEVGATYIHLPEEQLMAVVSAGSLCAGARELPRGQDRQYNVISIADDHQAARVHVREMGKGNHFGRKGNGPFAQDGCVDLRWKYEVDVAGAEHAAVLAADDAIQKGDTSAALNLLKALQNEPGSFSRRLFLTAASKEQDWTALLKVIDRPTTADELVLAIHALVKLKHHSEAQALLTSFGEVLKLAPAILRDLEGRLAIASKLGGLP